MTIENVSLDDAGLYSVTITGLCGDPKTQQARLSVSTVPVLNQHPQDQTVCAGETASFTASTAASSAVQWQVSADGGAAFTDIQGAIATILTFGATPADAGEHTGAIRCRMRRCCDERPSHADHQQRTGRVLELWGSDGLSGANSDIQRVAEWRACTQRAMAGEHRWKR